MAVTRFPAFQRVELGLEEMMVPVMSLQGIRGELVVGEWDLWWV